MVKYAFARKFMCIIWRICILFHFELNFALFFLYSRIQLFAFIQAIVPLPYDEDDGTGASSASRRLEPAVAVFGRRGQQVKNE